MKTLPVPRILVVTNLYPSADRPGFGTFVAGRVDALRQSGALVDLVAARGGEAHHRVAQRYLLLAARLCAAALNALLRGRRITAVEAHIAYPTGLLAWPVARVLRARLVLFAHGADVVALPQRRVAHRRLAGFVLHRADRIVANSAFLAAEIEATFPGLEPKLLIEPPGIDRGLFEGARRPERHGVLFVGRLTREKGADVLLAAIRRLAAVDRATYHLRVIGIGPELPSFEAAIADGSIAATLLGEQPPATVAAEMGSARVVAVPSVYPESLGLVAIEGLAAGAMVVASTAGGLRETIVDAVTGYAVEPGDALALADAIRRALDLADDPARMTAMASAARSVVERHDIALIAGRAVARYRAWAMA